MSGKGTEGGMSRDPGKTTRIANICSRSGVIRLLVCIALAGSAVIAYWNAIFAQFINFDDLGYIIRNAQIQDGLNWKTIRWALTTFYAANWHPLTWISHALD